MSTSGYEIIDTHAHLDDPRFDRDRDEVITRARSAGVVAIVCVGSDFASSRRAVALAEERPGIYAAVGVHPHEAAGVVPRVWDGLRLLAERDKVVAWGEIGLDFHYNFSPPDVQRDVFRRQLELAGECGLPVIVHDREAHEEALAILKDFPGLKGVVFHCFSGDRGIAEECLARGYYLGIGGTLTYPRNERLREIVKEAPIGMLLLETDCPYLAPQPWRGKRNEPAYLTAVVEKIAEIKGIPPEEVAAAAAANARAFFGIRE
ncbi:MAG: TatD family hydrolase [Thermacetogeniaceae bacterium]